MKNEIKRWTVEYDHKDGRAGTIEVETEVRDSGAFRYGNCKAGAIRVDGYERLYDLRYEKGDLHSLMITDYFGKGLVKVAEI